VAVVVGSGAVAVILLVAPLFTKGRVR